MSDLIKVEVDLKPVVVTVTDHAAPNTVIVDASEKPIVNVLIGGGRGSVFLPGDYYDQTAFAAILAAAITKQQLFIDLNKVIEETETGLIEAREDLADAIATLTDTTVARFIVDEDSITQQVSRLDIVELNITTVQQTMDNAEYRLSVAEGGLQEHTDYIVAQEKVLKNEWTVKIQENSDGSAFVAGTGLLVYPNWKVGDVYEVDDFIWFDGQAWKCLQMNQAMESNAPPNSSFWELIPYATKSQFGVLAGSFFVQTNFEDKIIPFMVYQDKVIVNGDMIVNGLISVGALSAGKVFTWSIQSPNYQPGVQGYSINALTGQAEFNNISMKFNYNNLLGKPTTLGAIDSGAAAKLDGIQANATVGATWGANIANQPADADILNSALDLSGFATTAMLDSSISVIQEQLDGSFTTWYYPGVPTLENAPASAWTDNTLKGMHVGDLYYDESTGNTYRFKDDAGYYWFQMPNTDLSLALANAAKAQDTADDKRRVFVTQPIGPYDRGDLWVERGIVKTSKVVRATGYVQGDWVNAATYGALPTEINFVAKETWNYKNPENFDGTLSADHPGWIEIVTVATPIVNTTQLSNATSLISGSSYDTQFVATGLEVDGSRYQRIRMRLHRVSGGTDWGIKIYYKTTTHDYSSFYVKSIPNDNILDEWHVIEADMSMLDSGSTDWITSTITDIRINLLTTDMGVWEIDWIVLGLSGVADITADNTAYDTKLVAGSTAAIIRDSAIYANAAVEDMESDEVFSVTEKRQWQIQWPGMQGGYTSIVNACTAAGVSAINLTTARNNLYDFLNTHQVFAPIPTSSALPEGTLSTLTAAFYTQLGIAYDSIANAVATAKADAAQAAATAASITSINAALVTAKAYTDTAASTTASAANVEAARLALLAQNAAILESKAYADLRDLAIDCAALINSNTTTINGGKITTGTITAGLIAADTITGDKIAAGAIISKHISVDTLVAKLVVTDQLFVRTSNMAVGTVSGNNAWNFSGANGWICNVGFYLPVAGYVAVYIDYTANAVWMSTGPNEGYYYIPTYSIQIGYDGNFPGWHGPAGANGTKRVLMQLGAGNHSFQVYSVGADINGYMMAEGIWR